MRLRLFSTMLVLAAAPALAADPAPRRVLAGIFGDHAVLQRDRPIAFWGEGRAGETVTINLAGRTASSRVGADGRWRALLPAMVAGGPYVLRATVGGDAQTLSDIMVGDVYLCGGQSNMEFPARQSTGAWGGLAPAPEPMLRFAKIAQDSAPAPRNDLKQAAHWRIVDADSVGDASAVCFYMARELQHRLNIPVGFIDSDWGGTTIQGWISPASLAASAPEAAGVREVALLARNPAAARTLTAARAEAWWRAHNPQWRTERRFSDPAFNDSDWPTTTPAGSWKDGNVAALHGHQGVVWYRQAVTLSAAQAAAAERIQLGPIDTFDSVWINGHWIGGNGTAWFWRDYEIPAATLHAGRNVIAIRVLGAGGPTGQPISRKIAMREGDAVPLAPQWSYHIGVPLTGTPPTPPWEVPTSFTTLYNGMIAPIASYGFRLAAWYQGEANIDEAARYRLLLTTLMNDWRRQTGQPALPFLVAQLAAYGAPASHPTESGWAMLRDAQAKAVRADPHAALTVTLDLGDRYDIHPTEKRIVGERLARSARAIVYGEASPAGGPEAVSVTLSNGDLIVAFRNVVGGLRAYSADQAIGFEACDGAKCRFVAGTVDGDRVVLVGAARPGVKQVRYAWADAPYVNLYDGDDMPAVPFAMAVR